MKSHAQCSVNLAIIRSRILSQKERRSTNRGPEQLYRLLEPSIERLQRGGGIYLNESSSLDNCGKRRAERRVLVNVVIVYENRGARAGR
jgi:predicted metalloprotease